MSQINLENNFSRKVPILWSQTWSVEVAQQRARICVSQNGFGMLLLLKGLSFHSGFQKLYWWQRSPFKSYPTTVWVIPEPHEIESCTLSWRSWTAAVDRGVDVLVKWKKWIYVQLSTSQGPVTFILSFCTKRIDKSGMNFFVQCPKHFKWWPPVRRAWYWSRNYTRSWCWSQINSNYFWNI